MAPIIKNRKPASAREIVVGVDPGGKGAIALYRPNAVAGLPPPGMPPLDEPGKLILWDMPIHEVQHTRNVFKKEMDLPALVRLAAHIVDAYRVQRVVIEKVGGMPGQGSGFTFGWNCGVVHTAFVAAGIVPEMVSPGRWKAAVQVPADKKLALKCAEETFPGHKHLFYVPHGSQKGKQVARYDRAEAALIAFWAHHNDV